LSTIKTRWVPKREKIAVGSEVHVKPMNALRRQNVEFVYVKHMVHKATNHWLWRVLPVSWRFVYDSAEFASSKFILWTVLSYNATRWMRKHLTYEPASRPHLWEGQGGTGSCMKSGRV
jgi:hypothetical protein